MKKCIKCKKRDAIEESGKLSLCSICAIGKLGLPWMNSMTVRHTMAGEISYIVVDGKEYLLISGSGGMLFKKAEAIKAEERFRGERELKK